MIIAGEPGQQGPKTHQTPDPGRRRLRWRGAAVASTLVFLVAGIGFTLSQAGSASGLDVVEKMFATYADEGPVAVLSHFDPEVARRFNDHMAGLEVWNDRLTVLVPCVEGRDETIICVVGEQHDLCLQRVLMLLQGPRCPPRCRECRLILAPPLPLPVGP